MRPRETKGRVKASAGLNREVLPVPEPEVPRSTVMDVRNAKPPAAFDVSAPAGAPNVLLVLIDDMGFGMPSVFGGPIHMPTAERLAQNGLRYSHFHTTALCSPTRAALLTGRNHHVNNMGTITESATGFPGMTSKRPNSVATLAEMLRLNGYSTAHFGKSHETPVWETTPSGPTDRWPTRSGFDRFYGFLGGETNQWEPSLVDDMTRIPTPRSPGYHFMTDMTDKAIDWIRGQKALTPEKPFFVYFAPGATHAPHHAPKAWSAKYQGKFDEGWDELRKKTLARQIELGLVPPGTKLAPKPAAIKDWASFTRDEKKGLARQMEVFAGYAEYADAEIGRLVDSIGALGQLDNTLVFYILGDNGASAEGGMEGRLNEMTYFNGVEETAAEILKRADELGAPSTYPHMAVGWAVAGDAPFAWTKQVASSFGGTRNGLVVSWPGHLTASSAVRAQFHHVIDVAPTILEAAGLPQPKKVNGTIQTPIEGVSMMYTFTTPKAPSRHKTQYFEMFGNRAIYSDGWLAGTIHRAPWENQPRATLEEDQWELYDVRADFSLATNLASREPAKLKALQSLFVKEAIEHHAFPLDDRFMERLEPTMTGRPDLMAGRSSVTLRGHVVGINENAFLNLKNRSFSVLAEVEVPAKGADGVIIAEGGAFGGWTLYVADRTPVFEYNFLGRERFEVRASEPLPAGRSSLRFDFAYDGGGTGKGGTGRFRIGDKSVGEGRIERTEPGWFSAYETVDVGEDDASPVSNKYRGGANRFTGTIVSVTVETKPVSVAERDTVDAARAESLRRVAEAN